MHVDKRKPALAAVGRGQGYRGGSYPASGGATTGTVAGVTPIGCFAEAIAAATRRSSQMAPCAKRLASPAAALKL